MSLMNSLRRQCHVSLTSSVSTSVIRLLSSHNYCNNYNSKRSTSRITHRSIHSTSMRNNDNKENQNDKSVHVDILKMIRDAKKNKRDDILLQSFQRALNHNTELDASHCLDILSAFCRALRTPSYDFTKVMVVYEIIRENKAVNFHVFRDMMAICRHHKNHRLALEVNKDYESHIKHNELSLGLLISTLSDMNAAIQTMKYYNLYRSQMFGKTGKQGLPNEVTVSRKFKPLDFQIHLNVVKMLSHNDHALLSVEVLHDFAEDNEKYMLSEAEGQTDRSNNTKNEPSFITSELLSNDDSLSSVKLMELFEDGLLRYETLLVKTILTWLVDAHRYHQQYVHEATDGTQATNTPICLPRGLLRSCFKLAGALRHSEISDLTKSLCDICNIELDKEELSYLYISYCRTRSVEAAIETLMIAEACDIKFFSSMPPPNVKMKLSGDGLKKKQFKQANNMLLLGPRFIHLEMSKMFTSLQAADKFYYALVALAEANMKVPLTALNALVIVYGRLMFLDRSFAMLQEFESVFKVSPDAHTYHALLAAVARSKVPRVEYMLQLLSDMDDMGYAPDSGCYSLLLHAMIQRNDMDGITGILEHLKSSATTVSTKTEDDTEHKIVTVDVTNWPSLQSLRQLGVYFTKRGDIEQSENVLQMIRDKSTSKALPRYFVQRLEKLSKHHSIE